MFSERDQDPFPMKGHMDQPHPDRSAEVINAAARLEAALETVAASSPNWSLKPGQIAVLAASIESDPRLVDGIAALLRHQSEKARRRTIEMKLLSDQIQGMVKRLRRK